MVLALEHLHKLGIVYRDLKPENVLIDREGYIRITDFGLSRVDMYDGDVAKTICGTPEYLAPEIIMKLGYGKAIDWWTLGSIIYEMLTGMPPFFCNQRTELFNRIKFSGPKYPSSLSDEQKDIIKALLRKDPIKRLGSNSVKEIKNHRWFRKINWDDLINKKYQAPSPVIRDQDDLQHFEDEFKNIPVNSMSMSRGDNSGFTKFEGFSFDVNKQNGMVIEQEAN